ncbi:unnamed protein product [Kluyveromyces dobzhanskii CBS 2104]|uniref:Protein farnesyltransferase subunit beta n=1 Tax=Kluyveromyces dobzhanskii CBS 2104 TaxID=1427455 RepID=A0A0A8L9S4_9SACH|nr:unnamed protein product [Kluyveromyces dobzhanskii CBS 2104]
MTIKSTARAAKKISYLRTNVLGRKREPVEREVEVETEEEVMELTTSNTELVTETLVEREKLIDDCLYLYDTAPEKLNHLQKDFHKIFLEYWLNNPLPSGFKSLDASQPWLFYWIGNAFKTLNPNWLNTDQQNRIIDKLWYISPEGGPFSGGKHQLPHLAANYASINSIALCHDINNSIELNKNAIYGWLVSLKTPDGAFLTTRPVGERDVRGVYTALSISSLLGIMDSNLTQNVTNFLISCQSYEGGFGGCPNDEAHGGYTFCAVASLALLNALDKINIEALLSWCSSRQSKEEKGLNGRSNKLVDGCYSFWVGGTAAILEAYGYGVCIDKDALKQYILKCCQTEKSPGLRDKPGTQADFYHTNYVLAGLSICEHSFSAKGSSPLDLIAIPRVEAPEVEAINPIYGITVQDVHNFATRHNESFQLPNLSMKV